MLNRLFGYGKNFSSQLLIEETHLIFACKKRNVSIVRSKLLLTNL